MKPLSPVLVPHAFRERDFVGGDSVLDFVNTVTGRNGFPRDWLPNFEALAAWGGMAGLIGKHRSSMLQKRSQQHPRDAAVAMSSARELRELLYRALLQAVGGSSPSAADLQRLHAYWRRAVERHAFQYRSGSIRPVLLHTEGFDEITDAIVLQAVHRLGVLSTRPLRQCAGGNCAWLFIDSSKAGRRRWCDMATCGNDAKAKRYLSKRKR